LITSVVRIETPLQRSITDLRCSRDATFLTRQCFDWVEDFLAGRDMSGKCAHQGGGGA